MNCLLLLTIITLNGTADNNTLPRSWAADKYETIESCKKSNEYRIDFNKWRDFNDEQGNKKSKSECICFK